MAALGQIVDQNSNTASVDTWALVLNGVVVNTILSNLAGIQNIAASYDYCVDLTIQGQTAGIGWAYTPSTDVFVGPTTPATNWGEALQEDFDQIASSLYQVVSDYQESGFTADQLATAFAASLTDGTTPFTANETAMMNSIYVWAMNGG
jgi:hypothetical protein